MDTIDFFDKTRAFLDASFNHFVALCALVAFIVLMRTCGASDGTTTQSDAKNCSLVCGGAFVYRNNLCGCITWKQPGAQPVEK